MLQRECAGDGDRRHGAGQTEGRDDRDLAGFGEVDDALRHRNVELARRVGVDDGVAVGTSAELILGQGACQADHLEAVVDLRRAAREDEGELVGERQLRPVDGVMAEAVVDVLRLDAGTKHMQHVEMLNELGQLLVSGEGARPPAAFEIGDVGRAGAGEERHRAQFEHEVTGTVAGLRPDRFWRRRQRGRDNVTADAYHLAVLVDQRTRPGKNGARLRQ